RSCIFIESVADYLNPNGTLQKQHENNHQMKRYQRENTKESKYTLQECGAMEKLKWLKKFKATKSLADSYKLGKALYAWARTSKHKETAREHCNAPYGHKPM
ncbi:1473_t:CDS:2, partial [Funneliformis geosporum]